jgi:hypothetical protein
MRRAGPYRGENTGPGEDGWWINVASAVSADHGELDIIAPIEDLVAQGRAILEEKDGLRLPC